MSTKDIVHDILNKNLAQAKEGIQKELLSRSYDKIQEMKPEVMKKTFGESVESLDEMTKVDKKTIDAFYNKKEDDRSFMVNSTGTVLKKVGFAGAQDIAKWENGKVKIVAKMDDRQTQEIVAYIKKTFPKNVVVESTDLEEARQLKDPKKEMLVVKNGKVMTIDKVDWKKYEKQGYGIAEEKDLEGDDDMDENAFNAKAAYAKKDGKKKFKLGDKEYPVTIKKATADKIAEAKMGKSIQIEVPEIDASKARKYFKDAEIGVDVGTKGNNVLFDISVFDDDEYAEIDSDLKKLRVRHKVTK